MDPIERAQRGPATKRAGVQALLLPHPSAPPALPLRLHAEAERSRSGELLLRYVLEAALARIRLPALVARPAARDLLWQHTCFEAFVTLAPGGPYHEINLSSSGDWAVYAFRAYREAAPQPPEALAPIVTTAASEDRLELSARIPLAALSAAYLREPIHLALSAVIEAADGGLSYLALHHPAEKPDFHHKGSFTLRLDRPT